MRKNDANLNTVQNWEIKKAQGSREKSWEGGSFPRRTLLFLTFRKDNLGDEWEKV